MIKFCKGIFILGVLGVGDVWILEKIGLFFYRDLGIFVIGILRKWEGKEVFNVLLLVSLNFLS